MRRGRSDLRRRRRGRDQRSGGCVRAVPRGGDAARARPRDGARARCYASGEGAPFNLSASSASVASDGAGRRRAATPSTSSAREERLNDRTRGDVARGCVGGRRGVPPRAELGSVEGGERSRARARARIRRRGADPAGAAWYARRRRRGRGRAVRVGRAVAIRVRASDPDGVGGHGGCVSLVFRRRRARIGGGPRRRRWR